MSITAAYVGTVSAVGVTRGELSVEKAIRQGADKVSVLAVAESDDLRLNDGIPGLDLSDFHIIHRVRKGNPGIDGCAILLRKDDVKRCSKPEWAKVSVAKRASRGDKGMAARYSPAIEISVRGGAPFVFGAVHLAPPRYPLLRRDGVSAVRRLGYDVWAGDLNLNLGATRRVYLGYEVRGFQDDVMQILARPRFQIGKVEQMTVRASDHAGVKAQLPGRR